MSSFNSDEKAALLEPLRGLQVDPTQETISMEQIDSGAAGKAENDKLQPYYEQYGEKAVERAYARGWRPKEDHKGNPDNWVDPIDFFDKYAERSDKRIDAIAKTVEHRMSELGQRLDRVDETDRQATEEYYTDLLSRADAKQVPKLLKERDKAIAKLSKPQVSNAPNSPPDIIPEAKVFFEKHPYLQLPETAQDHADMTWSRIRAVELETRHPNATPEQVFNQLSYELNARRNDRTTAPAPKRGRSMSEDGGTVSARPQTGKVTAANLSNEERNAFRQLVSLGAYKETEIQKYCDGLAVAKAEASQNG